MRRFGCILGLCTLLATLNSALAQTSSYNVNATSSLPPAEEPPVVPEGEQLHWIAFKGDAARARQMLAEGANVNRPAKRGSTPLHVAAYKGHLGLVELFIESGANVNARANNGVTPLDWARRNGHEQVAAALVEHGARAGSGAPPGAGGSRAPEARVAVAKRETRRQASPAISLRSSQVATRKPAATSPAATAGTQSFAVQLGAFGSPEAARAALSSYAERYPDLLAPDDLEVQSHSSADKSVHRLRSMAQTKSGARSLCDQLQQRGQQCFVVQQPRE